MAQDPGEIREAIDQTRSEIAETVQAIGDKADVKGRAARELTARREHLKASTQQARAKLVEVGHRIEQGWPDSARPVVRSATDAVQSAGPNTSRVGPRQTQIVWVGAAAIVLMVTAASRRHRRRRERW